MASGAPGEQPDEQFLAMARTRHAGDPRALAMLGARLMVGRDAPRSPADGLALLHEAAGQNDAEAWNLLAVLAATGAGCEQGWNAAYTALERAAALGHKGARRERQVLSALRLTDAAATVTWIASANTRVLQIGRAHV